MKYLAGHLLCLFLIFSASSFSQSTGKFTVSGTVRDSATGENLIGATVMIAETTLGISTNTYGFFSFTLPEGAYSLRIRFIGYAEKVIPVNLSKDVRLTIELSPAGIETDEVVVTAGKTENVESTEVGTVRLEMDKIKSLPAFMGEVDLIKTIQLLPGVMTAGEGNSGLYVRGGGPEQNLILVDDAVVYNVAHLLGFFSIFNADAVKNVELIKGGMPAQYGGRLASVLEVNLKEGNSREYKVDGGIGLIASRLTVQGPVKKEQSSFIVSARRTYIDVLAKPFIPKTSNASGSGYYFYDLNGKINYILGEKDQLFLSGYYGKDVFTYVDKDSDINFRIPYGNGTATLRWNHLFSEKLFVTTTASLSTYNFEFDSKFDQFRFNLFSGIRDYTLKSSFTYYPASRHLVRFGAAFVRHEFTPGLVSAEAGQTKFSTGKDEKMYGHEAAVYLADEVDVTEKLRLNLGLRYSFFTQVGPFVRYVKDPAGKNTTAQIIYGNLDKVASYGGAEPRISLRYITGSNQSVKAAYTRNLQYLQLATVSPLSLPTDIWIPSSDKLKPQTGNQFSLGYFRNLMSDRYESSVEVYYKNMQNVVEYLEGRAPDDNLNDNVDNNLVMGNGFSYGAEFFLKKVYGRLNGWIGYTISKTRRRFPTIDNYRYFPAKFDRVHDLNVALTFDRSARWSFSAVFIYATGNAITLPVGRYYSFAEGYFADVFSTRNSFRMSPYHRMDLSATYRPRNEKKIKDPETGVEITRKRRISTSWNFALYNVYNRKNPYFLYNKFEGQAQEARISLQQVSLFPVLPSVTWNFSF